MRIAVLVACLLGLAVLPASAYASQMVIGVYAQGPGTISGAGLATPCVSTAATGTKKLCGLVMIGYADEPSSSEAGFLAVGKATQPDRRRSWAGTAPWRAR